jgi:hypothetical protein
LGDAGTETGKQIASILADGEIESLSLGHDPLVSLLSFTLHLRYLTSW